MIFDSTNLFSDAQAVTADGVSDNVIDFGAVDTPQHAANALTRDVGKGTKAKMRVQVVEDFATLTSLKVAVQVSDDEAFSSGNVTLLETEAVPVASLVAGYVFRLEQIPRGAAKRYMRLVYTTAGSAGTAGKITAGLVFDNEETVL